MHCIIAANIKMSLTGSKPEKKMINSNVGNNFIPPYKMLDMESKAFAVLPASCLFHEFFCLEQPIFHPSCFYAFTL